MAQKSGDFHPMDMQQAMKLAQSDAAKQLFEMLRTSNGTQLQSAMDLAAAGNMTQAKALLGTILSDPKARALVQQLQEESNG